MSKKIWEGTFRKGGVRPPPKEERPGPPAPGQPSRQQSLTGMDRTLGEAHRILGNRPLYLSCPLPRKWEATCADAGGRGGIGQSLMEALSALLDLLEAGDAD